MTIYRRFTAFKNRGYATVQLGPFRSRPADRGTGMVTGVVFDPLYNAWFLAEGRGMIAFIEGEAPDDATHFEVTAVRGNSCRIRYEASDIDRLAGDFPSVNGWVAGRLQLRKMLLEAPTDMLKLVSSSELACMIGEGRWQKMLRSGMLYPSEKSVDDLAHGLALAGRALGELDSERWQRLRGKVADLYGEILAEMERSATIEDPCEGPQE